MTPRPRDTSREAWEAHLAAVRRLGPGASFRIALDMSESVRSIQLSGLLARNPDWDETEAVRRLVSTEHGIDLPWET